MSWLPLCLALAAGCAERVAPSGDAGAAAPALRFVEGRDFKVLETWQPHGATSRAKPTAHGLSIVPLRELDRPALKALIREQQAGHTPFVINVFASDEAFETCRKHAEHWTVPLCQREFLLVSDGNKVTWMTEPRSHESLTD